LPAEKQHELERSRKWTSLEEKLAALPLVPQVGCELAKCRKLQPNKLLGHHRTLFQRVRSFMPERDCLANSLLIVAPLRSDEGRAALRDMIALPQQNTEIPSRPGLEFDKCCCRESEKQKIMRFVTCSLTLCS